MPTGNGKDADPDDNDRNGDNDSTSNTAVGKVGRACASSKDEPVVYFQLHGRNEVPFVKMWGWTNSCPMECPNLNPTLILKEVIYSDGSADTLPAALEELTQFSQTIERIGIAATNRDYAYINMPVLVQIVAKKKPDIVYMKPKDKNNTIIEDAPSDAFLIGNIVVADSTGACILMLPNESIHLIYDKVEVGDFLIIGKASYRKMTEQKFAYPFAEHLVGAEIKVEKYSVRQMQHISLKNQTHWKPKFPEFLFEGTGDQMPKLFTPKDFDATAPQLTGVYLDIVGVVNYVGRVERYESFRKDVRHVDSEVDVGDTRNSKSGEQRFFYAYRWVTLIDKENTKPLWLKLIVTKSNVDLQRSIVPGMSMIITNCRLTVDEENRSRTRVAPTVCSQMYLNDEVVNYFAIMPTRYMELATQVLSFSNYSSILNRDLGVDWGAGGSFSIGISNPAGFYARYKEWKENNPDSPMFKRKIPDNYIFGRRERIVLTIRGKIVLVQKILEKNCEVHLPRTGDGKWIITPNLYVYGSSHEYENLKKSAPQHLSHPAPCLCQKCTLKNWFHSARRLNLEIPNNVTKTRELCRAVTNSVKELCEPLLMPAIYSPGPNGQPPKLAKQPLLKSFDHYRISIRDEENGHCYQAMWNTYSMEEMKTRYKHALGKVVVAEIGIFSSEPETEKEVILRDFIIEPHSPKTLELSISDELSQLFPEDPICEDSNTNHVENNANLDTHRQLTLTAAVMSPGPSGRTVQIQSEEIILNNPQPGEAITTSTINEVTIQVNSGVSNIVEDIENDENLLRLTDKEMTMDDGAPDLELEEELLRESSQESNTSGGSDHDVTSHYFENSFCDSNLTFNSPGPSTGATSHSHKRKFEELDNLRERAQGDDEDPNKEDEIPIKKATTSSDKSCAIV